MKKILTAFTALLFAAGVHAQGYMLDIGGPTTNERTTDAIVIGAPTAQTSLIAGITNISGYDQLTIASIDNMSAGVNYQKKYYIAVSTVKEYCQITSAKLAYDNTSGSSNFNVAGSYMRTSTNGSTIYGYGLFSATINIATGNLVSLKRWDSNVTGVNNVYVAAVCANGTDFYVAGNIRYNASSQNRMFVYALNGSNNLLWSKIDYASSHNSDFTVADIIYSPYQPSFIPELIVAGMTRPTLSTTPTDAFVRRLNANNGNVLAQNLFTTGVSGHHEVAAITPSLSSTGTYDGFLLCGTHEDQSSLINCGWVTKLNTTANAVTWSKSYRYMNNNNFFIGADITEAPASINEPYSFYLTGTAYNGVSGSTYDVATFKLNSAGSVLWLTTFAPGLWTSNLNETAKCTQMVQNYATNGFSLYGTRHVPGSPALNDMFAMMFGDFGSGGAYYCDNIPSTPYSVANVALTVVSFSTTDYATLTSGTLLQNIAALSNVTQICYEDFLVGERLAPTGIEEETAEKTFFTVSPNPSAGSFVLTKETDAIATVTVVDLAGREVITAQQMSDRVMSIDLADQPAGTYLVRVVSDQNTEVIRIVKQ